MYVVRCIKNETYYVGSFVAINSALITNHISSLHNMIAKVHFKIIISSIS